MQVIQLYDAKFKVVNEMNKRSFINANLANFRVLLKLLGGFVALDKVDVSHRTSA